MSVRGLSGGGVLGFGCLGAVISRIFGGETTTDDVVVTSLVSSIFTQVSFWMIIGGFDVE